MHGVGDQQNGHAAIEQSEVAYHEKNRLLLGAFDIGGTDELGATPEFRARPRRYDFGYGPPPADQRACICLKARASFDWHGFAGEHRLVDKDGSVDQSNVGGEDRKSTRLNSSHLGIS